MTRAESLAFVVSVMPPGYARDVIRATLKGWPEADVAAWHRLKDNERKQVKRDEKKEAVVRLRAAQQTGQVPVATEGEDRTSSGFVRGEQPDIPPSPQVSPLHPPSSPAPAPSHTHTRGKPPKPEDVPLPLELSVIANFPETWQTFIVSRRRINEPMTDLAAERLLKRLSKRPADAVEAVDMAIEKQWQGFNWKWFDNENAELPAPKGIRVNGFNGHAKPDESDVPLRYRTNHRD